MTATATPARVTLDVEGMTCAACAARIERRLNKLDSVAASVNYATEAASVSFDPTRVSVEQLLDTVEAAGYHAALPLETGSVARTRSTVGTRLLVAAVLTTPLALLAMVPPLQMSGWEWVALGLATPVVLWAGWPFHHAAARNARHGTATMDTLVSIGTLAAWLWSVVVVAAGIDASSYFEVGAVITTLILLGRHLEERARVRSGEAIRALAEVGATDAVLLRDGGEVLVPVEALNVGDLFVVRPGAKVATDGVVVEGAAALDCSLLTGEAAPIDVAPGDQVAGGTIASSGRLVVRATHVGGDTALAQIARLVREAQAGKAPIQRLVDRVSGVFVPVVLAIALLTLAGWLLASGDVTAAFTASVAVLIIACPCALGLATPTALLVGTGRGAQLGILIRGPEVLEQTRRATTIVLDKTGTVTEGSMHVTDVVATDRIGSDELLRLAAAAESASEHPIARAIVDHARSRCGPLPPVAQFSSESGLGIEALVDGRLVRIGRPSLLEDDGSLVDHVTVAEARGRTAVAVLVDGAPAGVIAVADRVKPTSRAAIAEFGALGLRPVLLTGDNERAARAVADDVGIDDTIADVLPGDKAGVVRRLQDSGEVVAMVGDGVNDAPALAQADLGLAMGTGTDVAIAASDLTLVSGDLRAAGDAIRLSRSTLRTIKGNLFWAFAYNIAAIPLAIGGVLDPMVAAAAMAFSSIFVVTNSLRLRRFHSMREEIA